LQDRDGDHLQKGYYGTRWKAKSEFVMEIDMDEETMQLGWADEWCFWWPFVVTLPSLENPTLRDAPWPGASSGVPMAA
jgi:hypothetical protein